MSELTERILLYIEQHGDVDTLDLVPIFGEDHQKIIGGVKSIESTSAELINTTPATRKTWELTEEGRQILANGSHEATVFNAVPEAGISQADLMKISPNAKVGFSKAMSNGWILMDKSGGAPVIKRKVADIVDTVKTHLEAIASGKSDVVPDNVKNEYKKRKILVESVTKSFVLSKGPEFSTSLKKLETDLTVEMLASGIWKDLKFKPYNFDALGVPPERGQLHPLMKVRSEFRQIFLEMGFSEMPTNNFVESCFWNFDALFVPQQHPARDQQDTFFVSHPQLSNKFPVALLDAVKKSHESGTDGSIGYRYDWKLEEAQKNVLRTHTTGDSARMLYKIAHQAGGFKPIKYFSIDKVFRNETLDATHLAEFHQVEGVVADYGITLGDLIGTFNAFFNKLGITELEYKPTFNPYTEPSMEIFCFHPGLQRWIEVGNSGVFRPEMLRPLGVPEGVNVIAWGLSLERPTMIKYGLNNIRDLIGPKVDLKMVQEGPLCRMNR
ncbi:phenylalanine--tRNA ligase alpha subunit [Wyeomyia smithii]|uniref:phenylalanine--tRNA ligase alpha subunit n=1 Tax=Wyeomyia smithii TaxID=174621 RepID=UPI002467DFB3|nr:phenylalanine--tRNA ligase alpha subunit [Wyeomyia smithii]XP_055540155.1 phenylalanine--tRNA ligase alpha subunit [Wyeomyia smithii]